MNIKVKKLHPDAVIPKYMTAGAAGFDLCAVEDCIIAPGATVKVPLGLAFEIPNSYELQIRPRSGISLNTFLRIANSPATIDEDYRGEVSAIIDNIAPLTPLWERSYLNINDDQVVLGDKEPDVNVGTYIIKKGDRICQGIIAPVVQALFIQSEELTETERGSGGFGHTGA